MTFVRFKGPVACMVCTLVAVSMAMVWTAPAEAVLTHEWTFTNGQLTSTGSVGGATITPQGDLGHHFGGRLTFNGNNGYGELPTDIAINAYSALTIEAWFVNNDQSNWQRLFDFGNRIGGGGANYLFYSPSSPDDSRAVLSDSEGEIIADSDNELEEEELHHIAVVVDATNLSLYENGVLTETSPLMPMGRATAATLSEIGGSTNAEAITLYLLGDSLYNADPLFDGYIDEFRIHNNAFSAANVTAAFNAGPAPSPTGPELVVDRDTGTITLVTDENINNLIGYAIVSDAGALVDDNWNQISENYDASAGGGDVGFDTEGNWTVLSQDGTATDFTEFDFDGANGGDLTMGEQLVLGNAGAWQRNPIEDLEFELILSDDSRYAAPVRFEGNGGEMFDPLDLSLNGMVGMEDWEIFRDNHLRDFDEEGLTGVEAALLGDLTGDGDSDFADFIEFRDGFTAAAGAGSFVAALEAAGGAAVPEPATGLLLMCACSGLSLLRSRRRQASSRVA